MPWAVAAAAVGVAGSVYTSGKAAKGQQGAADAATAEQRRQYDTTRADQAPYREAGTNALANLVNLSGQFGHVPTAAEVMATPGYQFGLDTGRNALEGGAAARGGLYSGQAGRDLVKFGNDYGTQQYDKSFNRLQTGEGNIWNRYSGLAGIGQTATQQTNNAGQAMASNVGGILTGNANAQGAATIAKGNALQNGLNQGVSWWNNRQQLPVTTQPVNLGSYDPGYWAEGGPVRTGRALSDQVSGERWESLPPKVRALYEEWAKPQGFAAGGSVFSDGLDLNRLMPRVGWGGPQALQPAAMASNGDPQAQPMQPAAPLPPAPPVAQPAPMQPSQMMRWGQHPGDPGQIQPRTGFQQPNRMQAFADGGRVEPVIGSRTPLPQGGTGGGLDTNAILRLLIAQRQIQQPELRQPLPADPLMNQRAILAARMRTAGQYTQGGGVHGPGGPKDDMIPARLSDGEHVIDAASVNAIGGGNNAVGQNRLNQLRAMLKGAHHGA